MWEKWREIIRVDKICISEIRYESFIIFFLSRETEKIKNNNKVPQYLLLQNWLNRKENIIFLEQQKVRKLNKELSIFNFESPIDFMSIKLRFWYLIL